MAKKVMLRQKSSQKEVYSLDEIRQSLKKNNACYVLITCADPSSDGKMDVQMFYDGDEVLASYLLNSAQQVFDEPAMSESN